MFIFPKNKCWFKYKSALFKYFFKTLVISSFICLPTFSFTSSTKSLINNSPKEVIDQVWQIIYRDYLDTSGRYNKDKWIEKRKEVLSRKYDDDEDSYQTIRDMLSALEDPYTRFLDPREFKEMKIDTSGELSGIGIQISIDQKNNNIIVVSPIEGSPASDIGIKAKDIIISVDKTYIKGMGIEKVVKLIRGKVGSSVTLGILREGKQIKYSIVRARIKISSIVSRLNYTKDGRKLGYIRLKQFSANAPKEMRKTILSLEKKFPEAYVLDLRGNPGGLLESSIDISRQFLDKGIIVSTKTKNGIKDIRRARGNALTSKPLAILVDEGSASASEIVSGAVQDNKRGILVGKKTFGKGLVQSVRSLADGSGLTVTVAKYLTPNGRDIHKNGIIPDIEASVKLKNNQRLNSYELGTELDSQYKIAENTLINNYMKRKVNSLFIPSSSNYKYALR